MPSGFSLRASRKGLISVGVAIVAIAAVGLAVWQLAFKLQTEATHRNLQERVSLYESTIRQTIDRFAYLPFVLSQDPRIAHLLQDPANPALIAETDAILADLTEASGAAALYVLNTNGLTLASSNWNLPQSFVGQNYGFRPYFIDALTKGRGRFYAVGVTTGEPGYFLSARVGPADAPYGVATVKISLKGLESEWRAANEAVLLADDNGIVFLSSRPDWIYRALLPVPETISERIKETHQYGLSDLQRQPLFAPKRSDDDARIFAYAENGKMVPLLIADRTLAEHNWTVAVLSSFAEINKQAASAAAIAALAAMVIMLLGVVWLQRSATVQAKLRAHDMLEQRVTERTHDLTVANQRLATEIEQRWIAESNLRQTQDELIHAGKLAALGHMSAAVSHEINQPLTALRTYVSSTAKLIRQGQLKLVVQNMSRMEALLIRISEITGHLRRFARAETSQTGICEIRSAVKNALDLVNARIEAEGIALSVSKPSRPLFVRGTDSRLEQVLVNLLNNAIDAMHASGTRRIGIVIAGTEDDVTVEVEDSGCGIPAEHQGLIFAPFFTTKEVGAGLGLGLSISHTIITSFGGTLKARPGASGGARFIIELKAASQDSFRPMEAAE